MNKRKLNKWFNKNAWLIVIVAEVIFFGGSAVAYLILK